MAVLDDESELQGVPPVPGDGEHLQESAADIASVVSAAASIGNFGLAVQMYRQRRKAEPRDDLENPSVDEYDPGFAGREDYEPGFAGQNDYDPGFSEQNDPVLDLTLDDDLPHRRGGQEYYPGFEELD